MADPRSTVNFTGLDFESRTYKYDSTITYDAAVADGAAEVGRAVTMGVDDTVGLAADGNRVVGKLLSVDSDGYCTVQTEGVMTLPAGASASVTVGKGVVGALGAASAKGYVREATTGDELTWKGCIINNNTTTAVVIDLC